MSDRDVRELVTATNELHEKLNEAMNRLDQREGEGRTLRMSADGGASSLPS